MDKHIETIFSEILTAIETGTANANEKAIKITTNLNHRRLLVHTGEIYAGCIGIAICDVIKKYTEGEG